jgi:hypothetical protein
VCEQSSFPSFSAAFGVDFFFFSHSDRCSNISRKFAIPSCLRMLKTFFNEVIYHFYGSFFLSFLKTSVQAFYPYLLREFLLVVMVVVAFFFFNCWVLKSSSCILEQVFCEMFGLQIFSPSFFLFYLFSSHGL